MKQKTIGNMKRALATVLCITMAATIPSMPSKVSVVKAATESSEKGIFEDFETDAQLGQNWGATIEKTDDAKSGSGALKVVTGTETYQTYVYDVSQLAGKTVNVSAWVKTISDVDSIHFTTNDESYSWNCVTALTQNEWTEMKSTFEIPATAANMYFEIGTGMEFIIDDVKIEVDGTVPEIVEDFNVEDTSALKGFKKGNPTFELINLADEGNKALKVTRNQNWEGYSYDVANFAGNTIEVSADVAFVGAADETTEIKASISHVAADGTESWLTVATGSAIVATEEPLSKDKLTTVTGQCEVPENGKSDALYFETPAGIDYIIDNISVKVIGEYKKPETNNYVDISNYLVLKDLYKDYFKMGMAGQAISHWGDKNSEIGNPYKEALIKKEFNSFTFGNELKPEYTMGIDDPNTTDENLEFVPTPAVIELLDWCKNNGLQVRGHVLVWHSQCADEIFCKDYTPVYVDPDATNKVLDTSCYVDKAILQKRMESYIDNAIKWTYENGYGNTIYAWDVVNEAINPGENEYNMRGSYWYQILGEDFMYYAFKAAREAVTKYASLNNAAEAKLFYNDFNENQPVKVKAIIDAFTRESNGHGSIIGDGFVDGMGMQAHYSDTTSIETVMSALKAYDEAFGEVHVTELDVKESDIRSINADIYQAEFYRDLFQGYVDAVKAGVNLTSVTIWGLTDETSWIENANPLIFKETLATKPAFDAICSVIDPSITIPEPIYIAPDISDAMIDFEKEGDTVESVGFIPRGDGILEIQSEVVHNGKAALKDSQRSANWNGASIDVSRFNGQTVEISAWVKSANNQVKLSADIDGSWPNIAGVDTSNGGWVELKGTYRIPLDQASLRVYFEGSELEDIYIDDVSIKLVGLVESFESPKGSFKVDEENGILKPTIAEVIYNGLARGDGHQPVINVVDSESHNKDGYSLQVARQEKDATVKFDVSKYVGKKVNIEVYVKTDDSNITLGFEGTSAEAISTVKSVAGDWTKVTGSYTIPEGLRAASLYVETDGNAVMYIDDLFVSDVSVPTVNPSQPSNPSYPSYPSSPSTPSTPSVTPDDKTTEDATTETKPVVNETETSKTVTFGPNSKGEVSADKEELKSGLASGKDVSFEIVDEDGKVVTSWTFKADNYDKKAKLTNIDLSIATESAAKVGYEKGLSVDFKQEGKLPMQATVTVNTNGSFKAGDKAYLYIVNKKTGKLDCVPNSKYVVDKNGCVSINVVKGADYVLLPKAAKASEKASVLSQITVKKLGSVVKGKKATITVKLPDTLAKVSSLKKFDKKANAASYGVTITYSTSNKKVATIDKNGKVTAKSKGKATITVKVKLSNGTAKSFKQTIEIK